MMLGNISQYGVLALGSSICQFLLQQQEKPSSQMVFSTQTMQTTPFNFW